MTGSVGLISYKSIKPGSGREWYYIRPPRSPRILMVNVLDGTELVGSEQPTDRQVGVTDGGIFLPRCSVATLAQSDGVCSLTVVAARDLFVGEAPYGSARFKYLFTVDGFNRMAAVDWTPQDDGGFSIESFAKRFDASCPILAEQWARAQHDAEVFCGASKQHTGGRHD